MKTKPSTSTAALHVALTAALSSGLPQGMSLFGEATVTRGASLNGLDYCEDSARQRRRLVLPPPH